MFIFWGGLYFRVLVGCDWLSLFFRVGGLDMYISFFVFLFFFVIGEILFSCLSFFLFCIIKVIVEYLFYLIFDFLFLL